MAKTPEPHAALLVRLMNGTATEQDAATAGANYKRWVREEWDGDEDFCIAWTGTALIQAYGSEWRSYSEDDQIAHLWFFNFMCIPKDDVDFEARGYRNGVLAQGGFQKTAMRIRPLLGGR